MAKKKLSSLIALEGWKGKDGNLVNVGPHPALELSQDYLLKTSLSVAQIPPARKAEIGRKYRYGAERLSAMQDLPVPIAIDLLSRQQLLFEDQQALVYTGVVTPKSPLADLVAALQPVQDPRWREYTRVKKVKDLARLLSSKYLSSRQKGLLRIALELDSSRRKEIRMEKERKLRAQRAKKIASKQIRRKKF